MKRLYLIVVISSLMLLAIPINSAYAASVFTIGSTQYTVDGQTMQMDAAPYIEGNRVFLPLRFVANALGVTDSNILYNPKTQEVDLFKDSGCIKLLIGNTTMYVATNQGAEINNATITMDVAPVLIADRVYLPISWLAHAWGIDDVWDAASQTITLGDSSSSQQATSTIPATPSITMTSFNVSLGSSSPVTLFPGMNVQLTVTATMSDGSTSDITNTATYSSSNTSVATVSSTGLVTCLAQGLTTITVTDFGLATNVVATVNAPTTQPSSVVAPLLQSIVNKLNATLPSTNNQENQEVQITIEKQTEENIIATAQQSIANLKTDAQNQTNQIQNSDNPLIQTYNNQEQQQISQVDADDSARGASSSVIASDEQEVRNEYDPLIQGEQSAEQSAVNSINQTLQSGINQQEQIIAQAQAALQ